MYVVTDDNASTLKSFAYYMYHQSVFLGMNVSIQMHQV